MKLYIVWKGDEYDSEVCDITTDENNAKLLKRFYSRFKKVGRGYRFEGDGYDPDAYAHTWIEERDTDKTNVDEVNVLLTSHKNEYDVVLLENGEVSGIYETQVEVYNVKKPVLKHFPVTLNRGTPYYRTIVYAKNEDEAKAIAIQLYKEHKRI